MKKKQNLRLKDLEELIRYQYQLASRGKSAQNLLALINDYQLDPELDIYPKQIYIIHKNTFILQEDFLGLSFLLQRGLEIYKYDELDDILNKICELALDEELQSFYKLSQDYIKNQSEGIQKELHKSVISYVLNTLSKYYINLNLSTIKKIINATNQEIVDVARRNGHKLELEYFYFKDKQIKINISEILTNKMSQIANVASLISKFE